MGVTRVLVDGPTLLEKANKLIREHIDYIQGMNVTTVVQKGDVLVFGGEYFLDTNGLPTAQSVLVFNMFKYLAHELSDKFELKS